MYEARERTVYKLINMSQVGTPSYIAPELRFLIESHLTYQSVATINERMKLCERHVYKGDIFSFGCILYELAYRRVAFENKFLLPRDTFAKTCLALSNSNTNSSTLTSSSASSSAFYSDDLRRLIRLCLTESASDRPNVNQLFATSVVRSRLPYDTWAPFYKRQVVPALAINSKQQALACIKLKLDAQYKPIAMKSLRFNSNLIVVLANKHVSHRRYSTKTTAAASSNFKLLASTLNTLSSPFVSAVSSASAATTSDTPIDHQQFYGDAHQDDYDDEWWCEAEVPVPPERQVGDAESSTTTTTTTADTQQIEAKFFVYNEYGQLLKEINSFSVAACSDGDHNNNNSNNCESSGSGGSKELLFNFRVYDFCVDEEYNHLYLSTRRHGIVRFRVEEKSFYMERLVLDGKLDLSELNINMNTTTSNSSSSSSPCFPTCMNLVENESMFKDSARTTGKRRLIFNDRQSRRLVSVQVDLHSHCCTLTTARLMDRHWIKCDLNAGLTLDQRYVRQTVSTRDELICLFDDLTTISVYNLRTLQLKRTNRIAQQQQQQQQQHKNSGNTKAASNRCTMTVATSTFCLTLDSDDNLYSTNGKSIFNLDYVATFRQSKKISPSIRKGENLSHTISWMSLLTNGKLALLTDALQMEPSQLYILRPVSNQHTQQNNNNNNSRPIQKSTTTTTTAQTATTKTAS